MRLVYVECLYMQMMQRFKWQIKAYHQWTFTASVTDSAAQWILWRGGIYSVM